MPQLEYPSQETIDTWEVKERGVRDGSSPREVFEINNSTCERTFLVLWEHRHDLVKYLLGYSETWDDSGTTRLSRLLPCYHPDYPDMVATKVTSIRGHKFTGWQELPDEDYRWTFNQLNVFEHAEVTVMYEHAPYARVEDEDLYVGGSELDRYVVRGEVTPSAEYLQLPGAVFKYTRSVGTSNPHGVAIPFNSGRVLPQEKFTLTWVRLPENVWTPESGLYQLIYGTGLGDVVPWMGCVNSVEFYGRPPGTVLLSGVRPILNRSPLGEGFEWDLEYTFDFDPNGWNYKYYHGIGAASSDNGFYFVSGNGTYYAPGSVPDWRSIYNERDLNDLFSVDN